MSFRSVAFSLLGFVVVTVALSCASSGKALKGGIADVAKGQKYFMAKCNVCHPNGGAGAGPTLIGKTPPGPIMKSSAGGRHNVPADEYDALIAYITPIMMPGMATAATPAATTPAATTPAATTPAGTAPAATPAAAPGMKSCNCTCQCPIGTPPGQMQACTCQCSCPAG